eukprot:5176378-Lingulodinium_polyedra.AAC.1
MGQMVPEMRTRREPLGRPQPGGPGGRGRRGLRLRRLAFHLCSCCLKNCSGHRFGVLALPSPSGKLL